MIGYIYKIVNLVNNKVYIGQTIQLPKDRWYRHYSHYGSKLEQEMAIKKAIYKYGKENFKFEVIEECDITLLNDKEIYYIKQYNSYNNGYNSTLGGLNGKRKLKSSEEELNLIIDLYKYGFSLRELAKEFYLDKTTVKGILKRHNITLRPTRIYKLTQENRKQIIYLISLGISRKEIMSKFKISKSYLSQLITSNRRI